MMFERQLCADLGFAASREWLVTNGIGGYAAGTIAGILTRRYHGLLIAALKPPLERTLLVSKLDELAVYDTEFYPLYNNRWGEDDIEAKGVLSLETFHLEGTTPVWTFAFADALLEKRIWMQQGANTTYICYTLRRATLPMTLYLSAIINYRDHHANTAPESMPMLVAPVEAGLQIQAFEGAIPYYLLSSTAKVTPAHIWYKGFFLSVEAYRGLDDHDAQLYAGAFEVSLQEGESVTIVATTELNPNLYGDSAYAERRAYEAELIARAGYEDRAIQQLVLAADQFIVARTSEDNPDGKTVIAGYPWFSDWGRDTMISLPGLTLATGRPEIAKRILRTFARFVDQGMLPNRFPEIGETPEYNTVDATLWYFEAIRAYHALTADDDFLRELFPILKDIIAWHEKGTRYNIHLDPNDGLIYAGVAGSQLTWMDVKIGDWVVTPRIGKPIEISALWINALHFMTEAARRLGESPIQYQAHAEKAEKGFARFWNAELGYCYDVLDTPVGDDATLRPNQLIALALPHCPLMVEQRRSIVDICARHLATSYGLRSLSPKDEHYIGQYGGDQTQRDRAYHQGTVWAWLIGPFVTAHLITYEQPLSSQSFLMPVIHQIESGCVGTISEIFEGDAPFRPQGCFAQAWSVAEVLRTWQQLQRWWES